MLFNDGPAVMLTCAEVGAVTVDAVVGVAIGVVGVSAPVLAPLDVNESAPLDFELWNKLFVIPFVEVVDGSGDRARKNCLGFRRNVSPGFLPRLSFSDGEGDASPAAVSLATAADTPDTFRLCTFLPGVELFLNTASL